MTLTLNNINVTNLVAQNGIQLETKRDEQTVNTMDGVNHYGLVTTRRGLTVVFTKLTGTEYSTIRSMVNSQYIDVVFTSQAFSINKKMHLAGYSLGMLVKISNNDELWDGLSLTLDDYQGGA
ncbi:MAG: hypothetical protein HUJ95_02825 [Bacteroidales bacterium]|nr:hypothetical protein [Bacteroidales bacterium]